MSLVVEENQNQVLIFKRRNILGFFFFYIFDNLDFPKSNPQWNLLVLELTLRFPRGPPPIKGEMLQIIWFIPYVKLHEKHCQIRRDT